MTQPVPKSFKLRGFAIKAESTEGVDSVPTALLNAFRLFDGSSGIEVDVVERDVDRAIFGHTEMVVGNQRMFVEGDMELLPPVDPGHATDGEIATREVLYVCGFDQDLSSAKTRTRYMPISESIPSGTLYFWHAGTLKKGTGGRGNLSSMSTEIGNRFRARTRLQGGNVDGATEESLPTFDFSAFTVPVVIRKDNSILRFGTVDGRKYHLRGKSMVGDLNNGLSTKEYTQFGTTSITERKPLYTLRFARPDLAEVDVYALRAAGTFVYADFTIVEDDGIRYSRQFCRGLIEGITEPDIDQDFGYEITIRCIPSDAGGDEMGFEFGKVNRRLYGDLPDGVVGTAYSASLEYLGVSWSHIVYSVLSGTLPTGLTLDTATGIVSGTPSATGAFTFVIRAAGTDASGAASNADSSSQVVNVT